MKYEAKNDGSDNAVSQANSTAYVDIDPPKAILKCRAMGVKYDLITNEEWQSLARNSEL